MLEDKEYEQNVHDVAFFRAKRLDNNEWIEGNLVCRPNGMNANRAYIIPVITSARYSEEILYFGGFIEVDPKTVCRYTGLRDKNLNKIFEKDIVKNHMGFRQVVQYYGGRFVFRSELDYIWHEWQGETFCACSKRVRDDIKGVTEDTIIGNIFDDPEYLKELEVTKGE